MTGIVLTGFAAVVLLFLWLRSRANRERRIVSHDECVLRSGRLRLAGRPDRILRLGDGSLIPVEKKSGSSVHDSHRVQIGVYLILLEEETGRRPPYGLVVLDGDIEVRIDNTAALRRWTMDMATMARAFRAAPEAPGPATPFPAKCRACGVRDHCSFSAL